MAKIGKAGNEWLSRHALEESQNKPIAMMAKATNMNSGTRDFSFSELSARSKFHPQCVQKGLPWPKNPRCSMGEPQRGQVMLLMNSILAVAFAHWRAEPNGLRNPELGNNGGFLAPGWQRNRMIGAMNGLLNIHALTVELPTAAGWMRPVNEVTLRIAPGEALGLVGESGSGKTMLCLALMGLLPPGARLSGEAFLNASSGQPKTLANLSEPEWRQVRGREIAMIFQEPMTSLNPVLRIGTQIEEAIWAHEPGLARSVVNRRVIAALKQAAVPEPDSSPYWNLLASVARNKFKTKALVLAF